jgi:hypothetical protein
VTRDQFKQFKIGQRVTWQDSETDQGTVMACDWSGVRRQKKKVNVT